MICDEEVFRIGYITRQRGLRGEVEMTFTDDCFDTGSAEYMVLDMDGILVPFFWEEYRFKNNDTAIIKFEDIDNEEQARHITGHAVFYPKKHLAPAQKGEETTLSSYKALTGFSINDENGKPVGTVTDVDDSSQNILLTLQRPDGTEAIIPFHNDFLLHFDFRERTLQLCLPEGLISLND